MNFRISGVLAVAAFVVVDLLGSGQGLAQNAYIANFGSNTVCVIDTVTNNIIVTIPVGSYPYGVAASPDGSKVYVTNGGSNTVSVIDTATNDYNRHDPCRRFPHRCGGQPGWQQGLCYE